MKFSFGGLELTVTHKRIPFNVWTASIQGDRTSIAKLLKYARIGATKLRYEENSDVNTHEDAITTYTMLDDRI